MSIRMLKGRRSLVAGRRNAGLGVVEATLPANCLLAGAGRAGQGRAGSPARAQAGRLLTYRPGDHGPCVAGRRDRGDGTGGRAGATSTAETAVVA
jgi:hypothetical protein